MENTRHSQCSQGRLLILRMRYIPHANYVAEQFYSTRPLVFDQIPPLFIYILAHFVEIFLYLRYYTLAPFYLLRSRELNLAPRWMGQLVLLQPATFEYWLDVVIDDSRARKILG